MMPSKNTARCYGSPEAPRHGLNVRVSADETTAIGEPRPGPAGRVRLVGPSFGMGSTTSYVGLVAMGAGVGLVFGILGKLIG